MQVKTFEWQQVQAGKESTSKQLKEARLLADTLQKKVSSMQSEIDNCVYSPLHFQCISNACNFAWFRSHVNAVFFSRYFRR